MRMRMRLVRLLFASILLGLVVAPAAAQEMTKVTLYRNPNCSCCLDYAEYLRSNGFEVTVDSKQDLAVIRKQLHVTEQFQGCHVSMIGKYAVEGHVSADVIKNLLTEHPAIAGISVPGMPPGTPGMTGRKTGPLPVYEIGSESAPGMVFATQ